MFGIRFDHDHCMDLLEPNAFISLSNWRVNIAVSIGIVISAFSVLVVLLSPHWSWLRLTSWQMNYFWFDRIMLIVIASLNRVQCHWMSHEAKSMFFLFFFCKLVKTKLWDLWSLWAKKDAGCIYWASVSEVCSSNSYPCLGAHRKPNC